jgi:hypothetical protein
MKVFIAPWTFGNCVEEMISASAWMLACLVAAGRQKAALGAREEQVVEAEDLEDGYRKDIEPSR